MARIAIIGSGPAGLIAAEYLSAKGYAVDLYERKKSPGRKFLLAGRGGLNITHSEDLDQFLGKYGHAEDFLAKSIQQFTPPDMRKWCADLGEETFIGSSGRVFPKSLKASPLLRAWLRRLQSNGVAFHFQHDWKGWDDQGALKFSAPEGNVSARPDAAILTLGGASWPELGSDGSWQTILKEKDIGLSPLRPANCGFNVAWSDILKTKFAGTPLKSITVTAADKTVSGEAMIDKNGIEGGVIYALSSVIRDEIDRNGSAQILIDLKPSMSIEAIIQKLSAPRKRLSFTTYLQKTLHLHALAIALIYEADRKASERTSAEIARMIKSLPLTLASPFDIARAISTAGGIRLDELDENFMIRKVPGMFAAGEMLDWEAPTGGYLLQASFATGLGAASGAESWLSVSMRSVSPVG